MDEIDKLRQAGIETADRLRLSERAHLIFPHHRALDVAMESGAHGIGSTKRGVGQTYQCKASRVGIRPADLEHPDELKRLLLLGLEVYEAWRPSVASLPRFHVEELLQKAAEFKALLHPYVDDTVECLHQAMERGQPVLFEGSQGTLLDVDHGTYPYVTSSNTVAGAVCAGAGVGPGSINHTVGVYKAYCTRVGSGPMPTEESGDTGETLRQRGQEFGTTTGRPRRCGWFDAVAARYTARINGLSFGALTLLDVLDGFPELKIAVAYEMPDGSRSRMPASGIALDQVRPVYETLPGWQTDTTSCREWEQLPAPARAFVQRLEEVIGVPIAIVSVGPDRDQTIIRSRDLMGVLFG